MSTVHVEVQLSFEALLQAVAQLSASELDQLLMQIRVLQVQRTEPQMPHNEATLLSQIHQGLPPDVQQHYDALIAKRRAETLTADEYSELLRLTAQVEALEAQRLGCLAELARLRHISLPALVAALGIQPPTYA